MIDDMQPKCELAEMEMAGEHKTQTFNLSRFHRFVKVYVGACW